MKITDLLKRCSIDLDGQVTSKEETIDHMVSLMVKSGNISDEEIYKSCVKKQGRRRNNRNRGRNCSSACENTGSKGSGTCCNGCKKRCGL